MKATTTARRPPKEERLLKHRTLALGKLVTRVQLLSSDAKMRSHVLDASEKVFPVSLPGRHQLVGATIAMPCHRQHGVTHTHTQENAHCH